MVPGEGIERTLCSQNRILRRMRLEFLFVISGLQAELRTQRDFSPAKG